MYHTLFGVTDRSFSKLSVSSGCAAPRPQFKARMNSRQVYHLGQMIEHNTLSFKANIIKLKILYPALHIIAREGSVGLYCLTYMPADRGGP